MAQHEISFRTSPRDFDLIAEIADRAERLGKKYRHAREQRTRSDYEMDIAATHVNGCPLNLQKLLEADDFNFAHDVFGIERHLNRSTGELENCFVPRCAAKQSASA